MYKVLKTVLMVSIISISFNNVNAKMNDIENPQIEKSSSAVITSFPQSVINKENSKLNPLYNSISNNKIVNSLKQNHFVRTFCKTALYTFTINAMVISGFKLTFALAGCGYNFNDPLPLRVWLSLAFVETLYVSTFDTIYKKIYGKSFLPFID